MLRFCLLITLSACLLDGATYALLVGVGKYQSDIIPTLAGPPNDLEVLRASLMSNWKVPVGNIVTLADSKARKRDILAELDKAVGNLKPGDYFFFYYSGHGTSRFDEQKPGYASLMGTETGALVPWDAQIADTPKAVFQTLLVGERDIRPILLKVPAGATAFVVFDSCYSGETARSLSKDGTMSREVPIQKLLKNPAKLTRSEEEVIGETAPRSTAWPYPNVIYLSASSKVEPAKDIWDVSQTFDGKAHGALTNALLMGLSGQADLNHDQQITHEELFTFCRTKVEERYPHKPQMQAPPGSTLRSMPVFSTRAPAAPERPPDYATTTTVKLGSLAPELAAAIAKLPTVRITGGATYDLMVRQTGSAYQVVHPSSDVIQEYAFEDAEKLVDRLSNYWISRQIADATFPDQRYNVQLDTLRNGQSGFGEMYEGDQVTFTARADASVDYALLLDIDTAGDITVIYKGPLGRGKETPLSEPNEVLSPFGVEFLKLMTFQQKPSFWAAIGERSATPHSPSSPEIKSLLAALRQPGQGRSQVRYKMVSFPKKQ